MSHEICITVDLELEFMKNDAAFREKTLEILALFFKFGIKATFFVSGDAAEKHRELIHRISAGHEIAAHGYHHRSLRRLNEQDLEDEIRRTRDVFTKTDVACRGFRCPFLIIPRRLGPVLKENGFLYDSSLLGSPFSMESFLYPFSPGSIEGIKEIPIQTVTPLKIPFNLSSLRLFGAKNLPRLLPDVPRMFYFHPWELNEKEDLCGRPFRKRMLVNTGKKAGKILECLFNLLMERDTAFLTCTDWLRKSVPNTGVQPGQTG